MTDKTDKTPKKRGGSTKAVAKRPSPRLLTNEQKEWLVCHYACFWTTEKVLDQFKEEFGFRPEPGAAIKYNLNNLTEDEIAQRRKTIWIETHRRAREAFEASIRDIPIASPTYRVQQLNTMFEQAYSRRNFMLAAKLLEQAAKETGGAFTNKREVAGAMAVVGTDSDVPPEIKRSMVTEKLREAIAAALADSAGSPSTVIEGKARVIPDRARG